MWSKIAILYFSMLRSFRHQFDFFQDFFKDFFLQLLKTFCDGVFRDEPVKVDRKEFCSCPISLRMLHDFPSRQSISAAFFAFSFDTPSSISSISFASSIVVAVFKAFFIMRTATSSNLDVGFVAKKQIGFLKLVHSFKNLK